MFSRNGYEINKTVFEMIIGIKHVRELLKSEAEGRGFQQLPQNLANVNALENNV